MGFMKSKNKYSLKWNSACLKKSELVRRQSENGPLKNQILTKTNLSPSIFYLVLCLDFCSGAYMTFDLCFLIFFDPDYEIYAFFLIYRGFCFFVDLYFLNNLKQKESNFSWYYSEKKPWRITYCYLKQKPLLKANEYKLLLKHIYIIYIRNLKNWKLKVLNFNFSNR